MNNNKFAWLLSISAAFLLAACIFVQRPAVAQESSSNRDYTIATHPGNNGDALYVVDHNRGLVAVFVWDTTSRSLQARAVRPVADAFLAP